MLAITQDRNDTLEPILTLQASSNKVAPVSSLCFLSKHIDIDLNEVLSSDSHDENDHVVFRSQQLQSRRSRVQQSLSKTLLASCHTNGDAYLWDLQLKRIIYTFPNSTGTSGLSMKRVMGNHLAYQTRDGLVTIYKNISSATHRQVLLKLSTGAQTFCSMAVCQNNDHMLVLSSEDRFCCTIHDLNQPKSAGSTPKLVLHASGGDERHGMLMSLAIRDSIVACGMEDGTLFLHDIEKKGCLCSLKLSQNFVLGLDLAQSVEGSFVAIVGVVANAEDLEELPESERGTVAVVKCNVDPLQAKLRCRVGTCTLDGGGKPGVDVAFFRPDGRLFAIGGWDKRVRVLDRRQGKSLAILKGHTSSVSALAWANNTVLASGDRDGSIQVWNIVI